MDTMQPKTFSDILDEGLEVFRKLTDRELNITRSEAVKLLNFESVVTVLAKGMRDIQGKSLEDLMKQKQEIDGTSPTTP